jgi:hypothetical protein
MWSVFVGVTRDDPHGIGDFELLDDFGTRQVAHLQVVYRANVVTWFWVQIVALWVFFSDLFCGPVLDRVFWAIGGVDRQNFDAGHVIPEEATKASELEQAQRVVCDSHVACTMWKGDVEPVL